MSCHLLETQCLGRTGGEFDSNGPYLPVFQHSAYALPPPTPHDLEAQFLGFVHEPRDRVFLACTVLRES